MRVTLPIKLFLHVSTDWYWPTDASKIRNYSGTILFLLMLAGGMKPARLEGGVFAFTPPYKMKTFSISSINLVLSRAISIIAMLIATTADLSAEVHTVRVVDHSFIPANLTVSEGDSVTWLWESDNHDVVAGNFFNPLANVFDSGLLNGGNSFTLDFDRNFLNQHKLPNYKYPYFCTPHYAHGMIGEITVNRSEKHFAANPVGWQVVPVNLSPKGADCSIILDPEETGVFVSCTHNITGVTGASLRYADPGVVGPQKCSMTPAQLTAGRNCSLSPGEIENLWLGRMYINITSNSYPEGEVRGQIYHTGGGSSIVGNVRYKDQALAGVEVSNGFASATTDNFGNYILQNVPNGVYQLSAALSGYHIVPDKNVSPAMVNNQNLALRNFTANDPCVDDRCGICGGNGMSCMGCDETDLSTSTEQMLSDFKTLRNMQRKSLRAVHRRSPLPNLQKRIRQITNQYNDIEQSIHTNFPNGLIWQNCSNKDICFEADISQALNSYFILSRKQRRQINQQARRLFSFTNNPGPRKRMIRRTKTIFDRIQDNLTQIPSQVSQCP